jgi:hypothetical protein
VFTRQKLLNLVTLVRHYKYEFTIIYHFRRSFKADSKKIGSYRSETKTKIIVELK